MIDKYCQEMTAGLRKIAKLKSDFDRDFDVRKYGAAFETTRKVNPLLREICLPLMSDYSELSPVAEMEVETTHYFDKTKLLGDGRICLINMAGIFAIDPENQSMSPLVSWKTTARSILMSDFVIDRDGSVYLVGEGQYGKGNLQCFRNDQLIWDHSCSEFQDVILSKSFLLCGHKREAGHLSKAYSAMRKTEPDKWFESGHMLGDMSKGAVNENSDKMIAPYHGSEGTSAIYDLEQGLRPQKFFGKLIGKVGIADDGRHYAFLNAEGKIQVVDTVTARKFTFDFLPVADNSLHFAPIFLPGDNLLFPLNADYTNRSHHLLIYNWKTGQKVSMNYGKGHLSNVDVSRDGRRITKLIEDISPEGKVIKRKVITLSPRFEFSFLEKGGENEMS
ncbi:MAG: hypothetical protein NTW50_05205 [Candidatus Berkelbacteria bacterium]|nr:hypothetical protein [Candidatus Berkelbacteria bacterium]